MAKGAWKRPVCGGGFGATSSGTALGPRPESWCNGPYRNLGWEDARRPMSLPRDDVWFGLLDADRVARYYNALAARLRRRRRLLDAFTAFGSTGAVASLLLSAPTALPTALLLAVAVASVWSLASRYSEDVALLTRVGDEMGRLADEWQLLWSQVDALGDDEARRRVAEL